VSTVYDDAELLALRVVCEAVAEKITGEGRSEQVHEALVPYLQKYRTGYSDMNAVLGLVVALGRLAETTWEAVLQQRLGHYPTEGDWAAELESFEVHKLMQHQDPEDPIREAEADAERMAEGDEGEAAP
jgi:hypothetical protein